MRSCSQWCLIREHSHTELVEPTLVHSLTEKTRGSTFADDLLELAARQHAPSYELLRETRHYYIRRVG